MLAAALFSLAISASEAYTAKVQQAADQLATRERRLADLLAKQPRAAVLADLPDAPWPAGRVRFRPDPAGPRLFFFNHRETFHPFQLGPAWREVQRAPAGLAPGPGAPPAFTVGWSHVAEVGHPVELALRFGNMGKRPLRLALGELAPTDQGYGAWAGHVGLAMPGTLELPPGAWRDWGVMRIEDAHVGSGEVPARVVEGQVADLRVKELARAVGAAHGDEAVGDPWAHPLLGGRPPRIAIYMDGGRVGLPGLFKTHQELVGPPLVGDVATLRPGRPLTVVAHNFGEATPDDFPGRDRGYAYHLTHTVRLRLPGGPPATLRLRGPLGQIDAVVGRLPVRIPPGQAITVAWARLGLDPPSRRGVWALPVRFGNGSHTTLEVARP